MELTSVDYINKKALPFEETTIIPLGDIQLQTNEDTVDIGRLKRVIEWGEEHNAYYVGLGDYVDEESPSNRKAIRAAGFYDSFHDAIDHESELRLAALQEILEPTKGRWLGLVEGHHYHVFQDGSTTDTRLAEWLGCPFMGTTAAVSVAFQSPEKNRQQNPSRVIWMHHGKGGGQLSASGLNKLEHVTKWFDADIYLMGHTHKAAVSRLQRIVPKFGRRKGYLEHRDLYLANTGSFLKGYLEGHERDGRPQGLYVEQAMLAPVSLGVVKIHIRPHFGTGVATGKPVLDVSVEV
tara:strand:- start:3288 stop:4166 length:879 start_codon:yes stop_codon:yes gene_type:complete